MYNRRMDTQTGLITPHSTPVKCYNQPRGSSGVPTQRRLPRKPARPLPNFPEDPEEKYRLNHPVDFIIHLIIQALYQHLVLHLIIIAQEELHSPILCIWLVTTRSTIFFMRLASVVNFRSRLGLYAANSLFCVEWFIRMAYNLSIHLKDFTRYFWTLDWSEVLQPCRGFFRSHAQARIKAVDHDLCPCRGIDGTPRRMESPSSACSSPCRRKSACPPSPLSLRKSRPIVPGRSPRLIPLHAEMTPRSCLGHRVEDLHRILADCNEAQLEAAILFVYGLHGRAQARAGWKV